MARFMLRPRSLQECIDRFPMRTNYFDYYKTIASGPSKALIFMQFAETYDLVRALERFVHESLPRVDGKISAAIPVLNMPFAPYIMLSSVALGAAVNKFIDYLGELIPDNPIASFPSFEIKFPPGNFPKIPEPLTADSALVYLQEYLQCELEVIDYVYECEKYQAVAAAKMTEIRIAVSERVMSLGNTPMGRTG